MGIYMKIKNRITDKRPDIMNKYVDYVNTYGNNTILRRMKAYFYLAKLLYKNNNRISQIKISEFEDTKRLDVEKLIDIVLKYDVISFDIFDTLIFRNVEKPSDLFKLAGMKQNIAGFVSLRKNAEDVLRKKENDYYSIEDIYCWLEKNCSVNKELGIQTEFETEMQMITANVYMKKVYDAVIKAGKKVILISDMYWPKQYMIKLLECCGYTEWDDLYISCECGLDKQSGSIYNKIVKEIYVNQKIVHMGDNYNSDIAMAEKNGIKGIQYDKISNQGYPYRYGKRNEQSIGLSVVHALINQEIHNGITNMNEYQQYGYIYGGALVTGYSHWINEKAKHRNIEKLLFLSRDADIIFKVYNKYYNEIENEYVYTSRTAVLYLAFERYPSLFINKLLRKRAIEIKSSINETLELFHMTCLKDKLPLVKLDGVETFDLKALEKMEILIYQYKEDILCEFQDIYDAAFKYWKKVVGNHKTIAFVDINLCGTIMLCMKYFLNEVCHMNVKIYCMHMGTKRDGWNNQEFDEGMMLSYCFSSDFNRKWNDFYAYELMRIVVTEIIFSADQGMLLQYQLDENKNYGFLFEDRVAENQEMIKDMQSGIDRFAYQYKNIEDKLGLSLNISGEDAIEPLLGISANSDYIYRLFENFMYCSIPGIKNINRPMAQYFKENHYK